MEKAGSLGVLGILIKVALGIVILGSTLWLFVPAFMIFSSVNYTASAVVNLFGGLTMICVLTVIVGALGCVVLIPIWTWIGHTNLVNARLEGLRYSAAWATAAWFVPVANLFVPLGAMKELFNRSLGESEWQEADGIGMVISWWTFSLAWLFVFHAAAIIMLTPVLLPGLFFTMPPMGEAGVLLLGSLMQLGASVYLFRIVSIISNAQGEGRHLGQASTFA